MHDVRGERSRTRHGARYHRLHGAARKLADLKTAATDLIEHPDAGRRSAEQGAHRSGSLFRRRSSSALMPARHRMAPAATVACANVPAAAPTPMTASVDGGAYRGTGSSSDIDPTEGRQGYFCPAADDRPADGRQGGVDGIDQSLCRRMVRRPAISGRSGPGISSRPTSTSLWPSDSEPVAYHDRTTTKALILMTDGIFNTPMPMPTRARRLSRSAPLLATRASRFTRSPSKRQHPPRPCLQDCARRPAENSTTLATARPFAGLSGDRTVLNGLRLTQ